MTSTTLVFTGSQTGYCAFGIRKSDGERNGKGLSSASYLDLVYPLAHHFKLKVSVSTDSRFSMVPLAGDGWETTFYIIMATNQAGSD